MWHDSEDPLAKAWVIGEHRDARRLLEHADRQYETGFQLEYSVRPWASHPPDDSLGSPGILVHATWILRDDALVPPRAFWEDTGLDARGARDLIVFVTHPYDSMVSVTFSGADDPGAVADAIGTCFDAVLGQRDRHPSERRRRRWRIDSQGLDWRVHVADALVLATEDQPFSIFEA